MKAPLLLPRSRACLATAALVLAAGCTQGCSAPHDARTSSTPPEPPSRSDAPAPVSPSETTFCEGLDGLSASPAESTSPADLDAVRAAKKTREADLRACPGVQRVALTRTAGDAPALLAVVSPGPHSDAVPSRSPEPRLWLDGVPLLVWEAGPCLLVAYQATIVVPFAEGSASPSTEPTEGRAMTLERAIQYAVDHPELESWNVQGRAKGRTARDLTLAARRAELVRTRLNARGIAVEESEPAGGGEDGTDGVVLGSEPPSYCPGRQGAGLMFE
jgi:hypothetical protein